MNILNKIFQNQSSKSNNSDVKLLTNFYFYFSKDSHAKALELANIFESDGFAIDVHQLHNDVNPEQDWSVLVSKHLHITNLKELHTLDIEYEKLAAKCGGDYDGHDVPVNN